MSLAPLHLGWPREQPAAWLTVVQNELLATQGVRCVRGAEPDGALDGNAGRRTLEIFAAALSIEWG